jgi:hypothetical protein
MCTIDIDSVYSSWIPTSSFRLRRWNFIISLCLQSRLIQKFGRFAQTWQSKGKFSQKSKTKNIAVKRRSWKVQHQIKSHTFEWLDFNATHKGKKKDKKKIKFVYQQLILTLNTIRHDSEIHRWTKSGNHVHRHWTNWTACLVSNSSFVCNRNRVLALCISFSIGVQFLETFSKMKYTGI